MDDSAEKREFGRLVAGGIITRLPATPLAMRPRGWVDGVKPGDPVIRDTLERGVSGD